MIKPVQNKATLTAATPESRHQEAPVPSPRSGLTGRLVDAAVFQSVKDAVEDAAAAGNRWLSQPIQELQALVRSFSAFFGGRMLRAMHEREERKREEAETEKKELALSLQRRDSQRMETESEEKRRKSEILN